MRILGIDPGYAIVGFGVLDYDGRNFRVVNFGAITTPAGMDFNKRLEIIYSDMCQIIDIYKPDALSMEKLFFNTNTTTAIDVAQARGVILLACSQKSLSVNEYTPLQVKSSIVGYGRADKQQVQEMVRTYLGLKEVPKPDDTADALALAITHGHNSSQTAYLANMALKNTKE